MDHPMTAPDLLQAVGVDWQARPDLCEWRYGVPPKLEYTGPALNSAELDAILWVEGQRWLCKEQHEGDVVGRVLIATYKDPVYTKPTGNSELDVYKQKVQCLLNVILHEHPGHALARAIKEVRG